MNRLINENNIPDLNALYLYAEQNNEAKKLSIRNRVLDRIAEMNQREYKSENDGKLRKSSINYIAECIIGVSPNTFRNYLNNDSNYRRACDPNFAMMLCIFLNDNVKGALDDFQILCPRGRCSANGQKKRNLAYTVLLCTYFEETVDRNILAAELLEQSDIIFKRGLLVY